MTFGKSVTMAAIILTLLASCSTVDRAEPDASAFDAQLASPTSAPTVQPTRAPVIQPTLVPIPTFWIDVKYRDTNVNVAAPNFASLGRSDNRVWDAWYDAGNQYMVIVLTGTAYHYCSMPASEWSNLQTAPNLGDRYGAAIRGNFDCRIFPAPAYSN